MTREVINKINKQINAELQSGYIYLDYAAKLDSANLTGYANWYKIQAKEEFDHMVRFYNYLIDNGEKVVFTSIELADSNIETLEDILAGALNHEKYVTSLINDIYALAEKENDYRTMNFLDWFIEEQLEEEKSASDMLEKYTLYGRDFLLQLDAEAGKRTE